MYFDLCSASSALLGPYFDLCTSTFLKICTYWSRGTGRSKEIEAKNTELKFFGRSTEKVELMRTQIRSPYQNKIYLMCNLVTRKAQTVKEPETACQLDKPVDAPTGENHEIVNMESIQTPQSASPAEIERKTSTDESASPITHQCTVCSRKLSTARCLRKHINAIHKGIRFQCPTCPISFSSRYSAVRHLEKIHHYSKAKINDVKFDELAPDDPKYDCEKCHRKFLSSEMLTDHMRRVHISPRLHKCEICGMSYTRKAHLTRHRLNQHPNEFYLASMSTDSNDNVRASTSKSTISVLEMLAEDSP